MLTLDQARKLATDRSMRRAHTQFINRYYYVNPYTKETELRYVVEETTKSTKTVEMYLNGMKQ